MVGRESSGRVKGGAIKAIKNIIPYALKYPAYFRKNVKKKPVKKKPCPSKDFGVELGLTTPYAKGGGKGNLMEKKERKNLKARSS